MAGCSYFQSSYWKEPALLREASGREVHVDSLLLALGVDPAKEYQLRRDGRCCLRTQRRSAGELTHITVQAEDDWRAETIMLTAFDGRLMLVEYTRVGQRQQEWWSDEAGWLVYYKRGLPADAELPLPGTSLEVSLAYYALLGYGSNLPSQYGWMCEYSTVPMPPFQRSATLTLLEHNRTDLLRDGLRLAGLEGRLYATDALLYLESRGYPLAESDQIVINALRVLPDTVATCADGTGSYRLYPKPVREVLSDSAIAAIPAHYQMLTTIGWFARGEENSQ